VNFAIDLQAGPRSINHHACRGGVLDMWPYLLVFLAALAVDTIPVFAPPAWILLVVLLVKFDLNPWLTVVIGVTGSSIGRYILTRYIPKVSSSIVNRREDANLRYIGSKLGRAKWSSALFVFFYTLTPLSTTALFTAAAIARIRPWHILLPFFLGRLINDGLLVFSGKYASANLSELVHGEANWKTLLTLLAGLIVICGLVFVDWRRLLEHKQLRFRFKILKVQK
jgi:membrane protein DedA with SNARE-associated domain